MLRSFRATLQSCQTFDSIDRQDFSLLKEMARRQLLLPKAWRGCICLAMLTHAQVGAFAPSVLSSLHGVRQLAKIPLGSTARCAAAGISMELEPRGHLFSSRRRVPGGQHASAGVRLCPCCWPLQLAPGGDSGQGPSDEKAEKGNAPAFDAREQGGEELGSMQRGLIGVLKGYKALISPLLPPSCRFLPTCRWPLSSAFSSPTCKPPTAVQNPESLNPQVCLGRSARGSATALFAHAAWRLPEHLLALSQCNRPHHFGEAWLFPAPKLTDLYLALPHSGSLKDHSQVDMLDVWYKSQEIIPVKLSRFLAVFTRCRPLRNRVL